MRRSNKQSKRGEGPESETAAPSASDTSDSSLKNDRGRASSCRYPMAALPRLWTQRLVDCTCLLLIFSLAAFLRLYRLDDVPTGLHIDEVAMSVEARSIGQTFRDIEGNFLPLFPSALYSAAWGYKGMIYQPIYVYSKIVFEFLLPAGVSSVRLPSVVWGLCGVASSAVLSWYASAGLQRPARWIAILTTALLLSVSPWHHHFSRLGYEVISCPVFLTAGASFMLPACQRVILASHSNTPVPRRLWFRLAAGVALTAMAAYSYHTARLFAPLLIVGVTCICMKACSSNDHRKKLMLVVGASLCLTLLPLLLHVVRKFSHDSKEASEWVQRNFIFTSDFSYLKRKEPGLKMLAKACSGNQTCWTNAILSRRSLAGVFLVCYNYLLYLSPSFLLFCKDSNRRHSLSGSGAILPSEFILFLVGLAVALWQGLIETHSSDTHAATGTMKKLYSRFLLLWLLLWPLPASLCVQTPHAIRSFVGVPVLELIMSHGLASCASNLMGVLMTKQGVPRSDQDKQSKPNSQSQPQPQLISRPVVSYILIALSAVSLIWMVFDSASYHHRYITQYANESVKQFNREASVASFLDLKSMNYFNKSRIWVSQGVDNSFVYMLYAENIDYNCLQHTAEASLNEMLRMCNLPYEIVFDNVSSQYVLSEAELLLLDVKTLKQYPEDTLRHVQLVKHWHNFHGIIQLKNSSDVPIDTVDDYDEF